MENLLHANKNYQHIQIKEVLQRRIKQAFTYSLFSSKRILRIEIQIEPLDCLAWLSNQSAQSKIFWSNREGTFEAAGIGLAYALHGTSVIDYDAIITELQKYFTPENRDLKFFGGIAFHQKSIDQDWETFGSYRFIVPRFELFRKAHDTYFACNLFGDAANIDQLITILKELDDVRFRHDGDFKRLPVPIFRQDAPDREVWHKKVGAIINALDSRQVEKVVLARKSSFDFKEPLEPVSLLWRLKKISPQCFHFCFQNDGQHSFIGASPERLYKRGQNTIQSEAIAGTRPRGKSVEHDRKLRDELMTSEKERREHLFVAQTIEQALKQFCRSVNVDTPVNLLPLNSGQHLLTAFKGFLTDDIDDAMILKILHPTPAVGGYPTEKAVKAIMQFEPFKRGWYAGPIGYLGFTESEFAVGIRSGLICENRLSLYAGAGIVQGSNPQDEWNEIETKISNFIEIFENGHSESAQHKHPLG